MSDKYIPGTFVTVPFAAKGAQVAVSLGLNRNGRLKVVAFNQSRRRWGPGVRTLHESEMARVWHTSGAGLPPFPADIAAMIMKAGR